MSAPVRFLAVVVIGWVGVRAMTLGAVPGFTASYAKEPTSASVLPAIVATQFPPLPPVEATQGQQWQPDQFAYAGMPLRVPVAVPYYVPYGYGAAPPSAPAPIPPRQPWHLASASSESPDFFTPVQPLDQWEVSSFATFPPRRSAPVQPVAVQPAPKAGLDRIQLTSWTMLRGAPSPGALATGGTLGGSQAGARLTYNFNRWLAASGRLTSPVGGSRGAEAAAGVRLTPLRSIPIAFTLERRQSISPHGGGRSAFAAFVESGLYHRPMPLHFNLDAYVQAGVVGVNSRDLFADGAIALSRPVWGRFSAGFGLWGGYQPGLYRIDVGPRLSIRLRNNIYAHVDWRQRVAGSAAPASGPALTLAADF